MAASLRVAAILLIISSGTTLADSAPPLRRPRQDDRRRRDEGTIPVVRSTPTTMELAAAAAEPAKDRRLQMLLGDVVAAVGAALIVTPLTMIVDVAVTKAASGEMTVAQALLGGALDWLTKPLALIKGATYQLCLFVYVCTYVGANLARGLCEMYFEIHPALPVLIASTCGNMFSCVYKDGRLAQILGKAADPRPFPLSGYLCFLLRDILANAGGFTIPPIVTPLLPPGGVLGASAKTAAQLLVPAAMNLITSPVHLLGLSVYNHPDYSPTQHVGAIAAVYLSVSSSRILKGFCAYGLGGVSNTKLRALLGSG